MTYEMVANTWTVSALLAFIIWSVLFLVLIVGLLNRRSSLIRASVKYLVNTSSFLFAYMVYFSFAIIVRAPRGATREDSIRLLNSWVTKQSLDWFWLGLLMIGLLTVFNSLYQSRIEKIKDNRQLAILAALNLAVMAFGIFIGSANAITGLTSEIDRYTF